MDKAEIRSYYAGVRKESKKEIRRLRLLVELLEEQVSATKASDHRRRGQWNYLLQIVQDKISNHESVIKTHRMRKRPRYPRRPMD